MNNNFKATLVVNTRSYKFGRKDCDSAAAPDTNDETALNLPTGL